MASEMVIPILGKVAYDARNFADLAVTPMGEELWRFMTRPDNLIRMETATVLDRPAVEPLAKALIDSFGPDIRDDRTKQMIGHMARQVMEALGYEVDRTEVRITRPGLFTSAATYKAPDRVRKPMRITAEQRAAWVLNTETSPFNRWLDKQIKGPDRTLDLDKLYGVARRFGITKRYDKLNPGQQRMNIGVQLRKVVKESEFGAEASQDFERERPRSRG